jgi:hypothetical protein
MKILQTYISPDRQLKLIIVQGADDEIAVGFENGEWHTHPDILSSWLGVPESKTVDRFVELLTTDALPIILSTDAGHTNDPWVSDCLPETLRMYGEKNCKLRYWSGKSVNDER